jgi:hypothetical protein
VLSTHALNNKLGVARRVTAAIVHAGSARTRARRRSDAAMREVVAFVRSALQPAQPWNIRSLIRVAEGLRERQERLVDR